MSDTPHLDRLLDGDGAAREWRKNGFQKQLPSLKDERAERKLTLVTDADFRKTVRDRDLMHCRCCGRKVVQTTRNTAERAEVHHVHGRRGDFRHDDRFALLLCRDDHRRVTGKVNEKLRIIGTVFIEVDGRPCIDARQPVTFERTT